MNVGDEGVKYDDQKTWWIVVSFHEIGNTEGEQLRGCGTQANNGFNFRYVESKMLWNTQGEIFNRQLDKQFRRNIWGKSYSFMSHHIELIITAIEVGGESIVIVGRVR